MKTWMVKIMKVIKAYWVHRSYWSEALHLWLFLFQALLPKIQGIKVLHHSNGNIFNYQFGKVSPIITISNITAQKLSPGSAKYYGFNYKDDVYFINGMLTENVRFMIKFTCCSMISNTKADKRKYLPFEEQNLRYGVAVRVMDFIWITRGSIYQQTGNHTIHMISS